jgi:hypothetical protein
MSPSEAHQIHFMPEFQRRLTELEQEAEIKEVASYAL